VTVRALLLFLLLLSGAPLAAQEPAARRPDTLHVRYDSTLAKNKTAMFYARYGLHPDSAATPYLYYEIYDWLGTRYKYAGHSKSGVDCSGFVGAMYQSVYCVALCGGAKDLFTQVDTVPRGELREGDLVFFKIKKGQISHVGIYLGNNKFAHASVHGGVMLNDLNEPYYKKYFFAGGRLRVVVEN
jgi:murein DD-endopeptidase / murein LD-carboxypeptidase